jgi:hypothetical protein
VSEVDELATELAEERIAHQQALEELREARAAAARVRKLHFQYRGVSDYDSCAHCNRGAALSGFEVRWPCDTIKALNGEET